MNHGGKREGAGRPPTSPELKKAPAGVDLPHWMLDWMREQSTPAAQIIEDAVIRRYKLRVPGKIVRRKLATSVGDSRVNISPVKLPQSSVDWLDNLAAKNKMSRSRMLERIIRMLRRSREGSL